VIVETPPGPGKKKKKQSHSKQRLLLECCDDDKWEIVPNDIGVEKFISPSAKKFETGCTTTNRNTHKSVRKTKTTRGNLQATNPKLIYSDSLHVRKLGVVENSESFFNGPLWSCGLRHERTLWPTSWGFGYLICSRSPNSGSPPPLVFFFFFFFLRILHLSGLGSFHIVSFSPPLLGALFYWWFFVTLNWALA
jgi:hypothetical protein